MERGKLVWVEAEDFAEKGANILRHRVHDFAPVRASALRLTVRATYGAPSARVFEIRAY